LISENEEFAIGKKGKKDEMIEILEENQDKNLIIPSKKRPGFKKIIHYIQR